MTNFVKRLPNDVPLYATGLPPRVFFGDILEERRISGFTFNKARFQPDSKIRAHFHENAYFCLVQSGAFSEVANQRKREHNVGTLVFHPVGEVHSDQFCSTTSHLFNVEIERQSLTRISELSLTLDSPCWSQDGPQVWLATRLWHEFKQTDTASSLALEGLVLELLALTSRQLEDSISREPPHWLEEAQEMLIELFLQSVTISAVAATVGVHPVYLAREFRRHYHCTPGEYVRRLRVEFAARQVVISEDVLGDIALASGFHDQSHFTRTFKSLVGMTPAQYRAMFRTRPH